MNMRIIAWRYRLAMSVVEMSSLVARRDGSSQGARTRGEDSGCGWTGWLVGGRVAAEAASRLMREELQAGRRAGDGQRRVKMKGAPAVERRGLEG